LERYECNERGEQFERSVMSVMLMSKLSYEQFELFELFEQGVSMLATLTYRWKEIGLRMHLAQMARIRGARDIQSKVDVSRRGDFLNSAKDGLCRAL
jgi:hypothetical protein